MKRTIYSLILTGILGLSLLAGCGQKEETTEVTTAATEAVTETSTEEATQSDANVTSANATDRAGNEIKVPDNIEKIISMAPSTTRVLIDLGVADEIVAIDTNSAIYADQLPSNVQQFDMMDPDNESLVALEPDIIFTSGMSNVSGDDVYAPAKEAGSCVAEIGFDENSKIIYFISGNKSCKYTS